MIRFAIPGRPRSKARPRFNRRGSVYTPASTVRAEREIGVLAKLAMKSALPLTGALSVSIEVVRQAKRTQSGWAGGVPDLDNIAKLICDGMTGIVYADDSQIARLYATRKWGAEHQTVVTVQKL